MGNYVVDRTVAFSEVKLLQESPYYYLDSHLSMLLEFGKDMGMIIVI